MLVPALGAVESKRVPALVLATTALRFVLTGIYQLSVGTAWKVAGGVTGVVLCAFALYAAAAFMIEETSHRSWLPLGRRNRGRRAISVTSISSWRTSRTKPASANNSEWGLASAG